MQAMRFEATVRYVGRDRVIVPIPFDPDQVWGTKPRHHVAGSVHGMRARAVIESVEDGLGFVLGPAWRRGCGVEPGERVQVQLSPEGPQRADLPADLAAALDADPAAGQFFDSLAQFYRKGYLTWINATRRSPQVRAERIAVVVQLLADGQKTRPRTSNGTWLSDGDRARSALLTWTARCTGDSQAHLTLRPTGPARLRS